ncbi:hypothetical protein H7H52_20745 [Mycolicibacter hiberniae]|uniref:Uncharacterized protein n=2 Tax=Mycolicibacter hiberniae TaxID=29314 RepID=A0A7I7X3L1_9MYCO|nr:hypothetical protein [Mycolicibacter hiberniae]MCV7088156.1 hypothetical protein [Mycolicibacter hiberniae]BBZ23900.1 hypothetical protein MHIB_23180 [Mycolicibacter hiberniae]
MAVDLNELDPETIIYIAQLRRECAAHRVERNAARDELAAVTAERDEARAIGLGLVEQIEALQAK